MGSTAAGSASGFTDYPLEREALERILRSGTFERAPNLALILRYVCQKYFEGRLDEIKEYNIAVDALGRPSGFDQKRDSIVRVEAHRLRKRLGEYYASAGHEDVINIQIPAGTYVPQFVRREPDAFEPGNSASVEPLAVSAPVLPLSDARPARGGVQAWRWAIPMLLAGAVALGLLFTEMRPATRAEADRSRSAVAAGPETPGPTGEIRLVAGNQRDRLVDHSGDVWLADRYVTGGEVRESPVRPIARTLDPALYLTRREGTFQYKIPVQPGFYELRLHFAETVFGEGNVAGGGESSRVFGIRVNHDPNFLVTDVVANAGASNTAYVRVFRDIEPSADGQVHIDFFPLAKEQAFVNAVELIPAVRGRIAPIRLLASTTQFVDSEKRDWLPDACVEGGQLVKRHEAIVGAATNPELFQSERYGNFTYSIPVDPRGQYTVTLHFAESWFGPGRPGGGTVGARTFDVYSGGRTLLKHFDILQQAGGPLRAVSKTFRGLEPNAQGRLVLQFVPVENYALINSIEVLDEGR